MDLGIAGRKAIICASSRGLGKACALALARDFKTSKHSSLMSWFSKNIIQPGILLQEIGEIYKNAFDLRHKGDYHDFAQLDREEVHHLLEQTQPFIETIQRLTMSILDPNRPSDPLIPPVLHAAAPFFHALVSGYNAPHAKPVAKRLA